MSSSTTLAALTKPLTVDDASAAIYAAISARGLDVTSWKAGSVVRTLIAGFAVVVAALSTLISKIAASGFLDLATGAWLTLVASYVYGVARGQGTFATGTLHVHNASGGTYTFAAGAFVVKNAGGKTYRNTASFTVSAIVTDVDVTIQADELGSGSTTSASTITTLATPITGITCSNAAALVGTDPELDEPLRIRCRAKIGSLSPNGPRDAYYFVATSCTRADGSSVGVNRVRTVADGVGGIDCYLATASGVVPGTVGVTTTDLGLVDEALQTQAVPLAITLRTHTAGTVSIPVTGQLWISATYTSSDAAVQAAAQAAVAAWISSRPIGGDVISPSTDGYVYTSEIAAIIGRIVPEAIRVAVTLPAADTLIGPTAAPVAGEITVVITRVTGALI